MTIRVLLLVALPVSLHAQVGFPPDKSPFRDVSLSARVSAYSGYYIGAKDEAGVLPKSGLLTGIRADVHVGGPGEIAFRVARVGTTRTVIDPTKAAGERIIEERSISLGFADVGLSFNLTGNKSWHGLVPMLLGSVGVVTDFGGTDIGGFSHGTTFALGYGPGIRFAPEHSRFSMRADLGSYMYSLQYPVSYYTLSGDNTAVLGSTVARSQWRNNWTMSVGASYALYK